MATSKIYVAGVPFDCDARVVNWFMPPYYDAHQPRCMLEPKSCAGGVLPYSPFIKGSTRTNRFGFRPRMPRVRNLKTIDRRLDLKAAQALIRMVVVHFDGCKDSRMCFRVLHDERGLSCHLLIDWDGTIYQTLDLALKGFHAAGHNARSIGIEFASRGDAKKYSGYYQRYDKKQVPYRGTATVRVHGSIYLGYTYTDMQVAALQELAKTLRYALPNLPIEYPQDQPGKQSWGVLPNINRYRGYCGHLHTTTRKWDPGPFDFKKFSEKLQGGLCFPVYTKPAKAEKGKAPQVPKDSEELNEETERLYRMNEVRSKGGYFPVGPYGEWRLWHGGVHMAMDRGTEVFAPFPGRLVLASQGRSNSGIGSTNFVLLRHDMNVGENSVRFWSLYYHLDDELKQAPKDAPAWLLDPAETKKLKTPTLRKLKRGVPEQMGVPIEAGTVLGRSGRAGPADHREGQIHFAIFARDEIMEKIDPRPGVWTVIDGTTGGRFSDKPEINKEIDSNADGKFTRSELSSFYSSSSERSLLRFMVVLNESEWHGTPKEWIESLRLAPDFKGIKPAALEALVDEQITPTLWWDRKSARHAGLPGDGIVYHYHPLNFVRVVNERILEFAGKHEALNTFKKADAVKTDKKNVVDDLEDNGKYNADASEFVDADDADQWPLQRLVKGFSEDDE